MHRGLISGTKISSIFLFCLLLATETVPARASGLQGQKGTIVKIHSRILGEERKLSISLPQEYESSRKAYPVLYILDAEAQASFAKSVSTASSLHAEGHGPKMIVIGVWNTHRNRDMIPASVPHRSGSGGSHAFLKFFHDEMMPYVKQNYRATDFSVLYGGSNAALFAVYALLERPETFQAYIASSPMIGHCPEFMQKKAKEFVLLDDLKDRILYMIYGTKDSHRVTGYVPDFQKFLEANAPDGFDSYLEILEGEGHVPESSLFRGLMYIFSRTKQQLSPSLSGQR